MMNDGKRRDMAQIVDGLAATLSQATGIDAGGPRPSISQALAVWVTERSPASSSASLIIGALSQGRPKTPSALMTLRPR